MGNGFTLYPTNKKQLKFVNKSGNMTGGAGNKFFTKTIGENIIRKGNLSRTESEEHNDEPSGLDKNKFVMHLKSDGVDLFKDEKQLYSDNSNAPSTRNGLTLDNNNSNSNKKTYLRALSNRKHEGNDYVSKGDKSKRSNKNSKNNHDIGHVVNSRKNNGGKGVRFAPE